MADGLGRAALHPDLSRRCRRSARAAANALSAGSARPFRAGEWAAELLVQLRRCVALISARLGARSAPTRRRSSSIQRSSERRRRRREATTQTKISIAKRTTVATCCHATGTPIRGPRYHGSQSGGTTTATFKKIQLNKASREELIEEKVYKGRPEHRGIEVKGPRYSSSCQQLRAW